MLQNMLVGPYIGIPNTRNLYQRVLTNLVAVLRAMNSLNNMLVSTVLYHLIYHIMGALFKSIRTPVWYLLVALSLAWSTSTKQYVDTTFPLGVGMSAGIAYLVSRYKSYQLCAANKRSYIFGCWGSKQIFLFGFTLRYPNTWNACSRCSLQGKSRYVEISAVSRKISIRPRSNSHLSTPTISWYCVTPSDLSLVEVSVSSR